MEFANSPPQWVFPAYKAGVEGFDVWIKALDTGQANGFGLAYNAAVWNECRQHAARFLREAKDRICGSAGSLFDEAAGHYSGAAENLALVAEKFAFPPQGDELKDSARVRFAIDTLGKARAAEAGGLASLTKLSEAL